MAVPIPSLSLDIKTTTTQTQDITGGDVSGGSSGVTYGDYTPPSGPTSRIAWIVAGVLTLVVLVLFFVLRRK